MVIRVNYDKTVILIATQKTFLSSYKKIILIFALDPEIVTFVPDHLKTKKISKTAVKKLPFVIRYVPGRYKTKKMYNEVISENGGMLEFIPDYYKDQKMCDKAVDNCFHASRFAPNCYKIQKCSIKLLVRVVLLYLFLFLINVRPKKCVIKLLIPALKFVTDWFVTNKMIEKLDNTVMEAYFFMM